MSPANFHDARGQSRALQSAAAYDESDLTLTGHGEPVRLKGTTVSASFFEVLGVRPLLGRTFRADENAPGKEKVIVIDHALWQQRFGGRREIIDQPITIDGEAYVVVGIMPPGFSFPFGREAWVRRRGPGDLRAARASREQLDGDRRAHGRSA
jgi:putative ABC transport system permease protein